MQTADFYCDECGAANPGDAETCFACHHLLNNLPTGPSPVMPASQTTLVPLAPFFQIQLNLATGSLTMIQLQPLQPTQNLLYDRYQVLDKVGTGGFGAVYKARDTHRNNRLVAIKAIELDTLSPSQAIEATDTFNRELHLLSNLDHSHLPRVLEYFIDATHWYLVMDFINGEPLDVYLEQINEPCLPLKEVIEIGRQLCDVLRYLHQLKPPIIFRDVKPGNIMRTPGGWLYLIDFGIARRFKPGQAKDTTPLGSPGFAAPEQYGKAQTTVRSDIYGLGATLYFLLTGYDPANTPFNLPPIASLCPSLPEPLAELITSMLALDPKDRPASIIAVQQALEGYTSEMYQKIALAAQAPASVSQSASPAPAPARFRRLSNFLKRLFSAA
jgi:serine/threonine protein kinase